MHPWQWAALADAVMRRDCLVELRINRRLKSKVSGRMSSPAMPRTKKDQHEAKQAHKQRCQIKFFENRQKELKNRQICRQCSVCRR
jgi:hypothetical protein